MTNGTNYVAENYEVDYSRTGSKIYEYDFDGYVSMTEVANRIETDRKFDELCRKNIEARKRGKKNA